MIIIYTFCIGKSASNYSSALDTVYINEVQIGYAQDWTFYTAPYHVAAPGQEYYKGYVSLPWVNNTSGNMQNGMLLYEGVWCYLNYNIDTGALLSCQYYLIYALEIILDACGFNYDLSALKNSDYKYLLISIHFLILGIWRSGQTLCHIGRWQNSLNR